MAVGDVGKRGTAVVGSSGWAAVVEGGNGREPAHTTKNNNGISKILRIVRPRKKDKFSKLLCVPDSQKKLVILNLGLFESSGFYLGGILFEKPVPNNDTNIDDKFN